MDDGPLRSFDDPANKQFLDSVRRGYENTIIFNLEGTQQSALARLFSSEILYYDELRSNFFLCTRTFVSVIALKEF